MVYFTLCFYHVMYALKSESTLYSCVNVKELLAWNRCNIWSLSDSNGIRTHKHLVHKQTLNHIAKLGNWLSCVVRICEICVVRTVDYKDWLVYSVGMNRHGELCCNFSISYNFTQVFSLPTGILKDTLKAYFLMPCVFLDYKFE